MEPKTREEIIALQKRRDARFAISEDSPLSPKQRLVFRGLRYFPIDLRYQLKQRLHRYENPQPVQVAMSQGGTRSELRVGCFQFQLDQKPMTLQAYMGIEDQTEIVVPFRDRTSGKETYGGGRYVIMEVTPDDNYVLDFNLAGNPHCAYNPEKYDCPVPPSENWILNVDVRAGEMKFIG